MARPSWCPHPTCIQLCGGHAEGQEEDPDSGTICGGQLPKPELHRETENTHRLCLKGCDDPPVDFQVNASDLWYFGIVIEGLRKHASGGI